MNIHMKRAEFEALPFRDDLTNEPVPDGHYRAKAYPADVFVAWCEKGHGRLLRWECFRVRLEE
jgi:hypothetical protein